MISLPCLALVLPLAAAAAFKADIRVDTNRDGKVDLHGTTDINGKATWSETSGALFLPNIGDARGHCAGDDSCHDASSNKQWAPQNMASMLTVPMGHIRDWTTATISVRDPVARSKVRIFLYDAAKDDPWVYLENDTRIPADRLRRGLTLGIDARDTRRPGGWDGRVLVRFQVRNWHHVSSDYVMLRVAPVLTHHHGQPIERLFVSNQNQHHPIIKSMHDKIQNSMQQAGIWRPLGRFGVKYTWAQDVMEPAYASIPGPSGPITLRINVMGKPVMKGSTEAVGRLLWNLRGKGVGAVRPAELSDMLDPKTLRLSAGGNIETIPPYEFNGKNYPAGRLVIGAADGMAPPVLRFFEAQESQKPISPTRRCCASAT
ncbi:arginine deiminase type-3 [Metarhizium album ARSEF 1941]|uniref:Arginine deiminase type-3 n=1 Tax=Metarhizium album (strain ARSEF 1941) TaxID=1081103 RepID=A0A0B2WRB1_METAS|nr:arginine deiminase type-3 [Metarhizium album ARSEF 1941]KHN95515.1 arginine deiminase type-3 [Metarhizium album ARSEF 1941]